MNGEEIVSKELINKGKGMFVDSGTTMLYVTSEMKK